MWQNNSKKTVKILHLLNIFKQINLYCIIAVNNLKLAVNSYACKKKFKWLNSLPPLTIHRDFDQPDDIYEHKRRLSKLNETWAVIRACVLTFGFLLGSCSTALKCEVRPHVRAIRVLKSRWNFLCLGSTLTCVQVLTYLVSVVMEMLHTCLLIPCQSVADCLVPTRCVTHTQKKKQLLTSGSAAYILQSPW